MKPRKHTNGYLRISFGRSHEEYIHRVVCTAFHGPAPEGFHADHIDGTRDNNWATNLRWISRADNLATRKIALGNQYSDAVLTPELVRKIRTSPYYFGFDANMARALNVSITTVRFARIGRTWRHVE